MKKKSSKKLHSEFTKNLQFFLPKTYKNIWHLQFINDRGKEYCLWCKKEKYLIILELRTDKKTNKPFYYLKTAYPIIYCDKLKQMQKKEKKQNENGKN